MSEEQLRTAALEYHECPRPGKVSIAPTKPLANQRDLSLAYSPGVAYACTAIQENPGLAAKYTARANLVAVIQWIMIPRLPFMRAAETAVAGPACDRRIETSI